MTKIELSKLIADLQNINDTMDEDGEFDIGVCDINDNVYDVNVVINRMDLSNCKNEDGKPYPAELILSLADGYEIDFNRED
jgi:hypothetical protein